MIDNYDYILKLLHPYNIFEQTYDIEKIVFYYTGSYDKFITIGNSITTAHVFNFIVWINYQDTNFNEHQNI